MDRAFSDTNSIPTPSIALATLRAQTSVCRVRTPKGTVVVPSLQNALATADGVLSARSSSAKLDALLAGKTLQRDGNGLGLAGLAKSQPGLALLGFLAAHQRDRSDPLPLLDAAVMLSSLGRQPEALALLAEAARLPGKGAPLGINVQGLIDNARGVALFRLGQFAGAEAQFRAALSRAPGLAQAERNLAAALLCRGRVSQAVTPYRESIYVDPVQSQPASATTSGGETAPVPSSALDLSQGVRGTLPKLTIPATADDGAASYPDIKANTDRAYNEVQQAAQRAGQYIVALSTEQARLGYTGAGGLTIKRQDAILSLWNNWQTNRPDLGAMHTTVENDYTQMSNNSPSYALTQQINDIHNMCSSAGNNAQVKQCLQTKCWPAVQAGHASWLPQMKSYDTDLRTFASALYQYATGVASNVTSANEAAAITTSARAQMLLQYQGELTVLSGMTDWENFWASDCSAPNSGTAAGDDATTSTPAAAPCPAGLSAVKFSIKFVIPTEIPTQFELKANCDAVELNVSNKGPVTPYGSVKYKFSDGSISALVGGKISVDLGGDVKVSAKGGIYMNWDAQGNPTDVGVKVSGGSFGGSWDNVGVSTPDLLDKQWSLAPYLLN